MLNKGYGDSMESYTKDMRYENVCIEGLGYKIPEKVITSKWLDEQFKMLDSGRMRLGIEKITGIREFRWWDEGIAFSDGAVMAIEDVLAKTGTDRGEIQCLINASVNRDYVEPATASIIHHKVGLSPDCMSFDVCNACLGFMNGITLIANMIELGQIDTGMVVSCEGSRYCQQATMERFKTNQNKQFLRDNLASFTIGSAAVAMILTRAEKSKTGKKLLGGVSYCETKYHDLCKAMPDWMTTSLGGMLTEGIDVTFAAWKKARKSFGWDDISRLKFCGHQVSKTHHDAMVELIGVDPSQSYSIFQGLGNTVSASVPLSFALALENNFIKDGDTVCLVGAGSGINCLVLGVQW